MSLSLPQIAPLSRETSTARFEAGSPWRTLAQASFFCATRLAFAAFFLLTSVYCLLVWVPFAYFGFIHNPLVSWIPLFVRLHGLLYGIVLGGVGLTLLPDLRSSSTRRAAVGFLLVNGIAFLYVWRSGALSGLSTDLQSYFWSMLSLFPLLWLAALDLSAGREWAWREKARALNLPTATRAAAIISVVFAATALARGTLGASGATGFDGWLGFFGSLCFHIIIFAVLAFIVLAIRRVSRATPWPPIANFVLGLALAWWLFVELLRTMILPTISFEGPQASIFAGVVALALVLFAASSVARLRALRGDKKLPMDGISLPAWFKVTAILAGLAASAWAIPVFLGRTDWDFVLQRMAVIGVWLAAVQAFRWSRIGTEKKWAVAATGFVVFAAALGFAAYGRLALYNPEPSPRLQAALESFSGADISFKTAYDVLSRPVDNKAYRRFYEFLKQNTNLSRDTVAQPGDLRLVANLQPTPGPKPNIFLFVIDSLRQDFVSPYNPAVDFTPEIGRFAQDSVVLEDAYTRYGGTALSEPAIWAGAMQLHKQYIRPYYPLNNLQKLLETDGYQSYISVDPILQVLLRPSPTITELDKDTKSWSDLDFVTTLKELESKIDARSDRDKPIFAYTQPQNVHTLTLERSKIKGGRQAVSRYETRRMDTAFGEFLTFLRARGLYDNSIIIITADHGDAYGEFGRWGHSDFLFPQVIRIPLIFHLPPRLRQQLVWDAHRPAFTTDITPSLYYLLGHRPILNNDLFGRPLFTQSMAEQLPYQRAHYLIVCSYAPVYAILGGEGQSLFIVDAVNSKNYYYDLRQDPTGSHNHVTVALEKQNEVLIRHDVELIEDLYGWHPAGNGP